MSCILSSYTYCSTFEHHYDIRKMLSGSFIYNVTIDMGIGLLSLGRQHYT